MFRSNILNICSTGKLLYLHRAGLLLTGLAAALLLALGGGGCEGLASDDRDPLTDCLDFRDALCLRYGECLAKPDAWHATCLAQQDQAGGTCDTLIAIRSCYKSQSVQLAACAQELPNSPCSDVCITQGSQTICNSPCSVVCSNANPGLGS